MRTPRWSLCAITLLAGLATAGQPPVWRKRPATLPTNATKAEIAYDASRNVCVAVVAGNPLEVWEYDGNAWTQRHPALSPANMTEWKLAFDPTLGHVVAVLGSAATAAHGEVWEWTGSDWLLHATANHATTNNGYAVAFDAARDRLVFFGGNTIFHGFGFPVAETWTWDRTDWQQVGNGGPVPRIGHGMAYDSARERVVLFGGVMFSDTWEWDGQQWAQHFGIGTPAPRTSPAMTFDSARGVIVLFGGQTSAGTPYTDVWEWDGTTWTANVTPTSPPAPGPVAYDEDREVTVALARNGNVFETWEYGFITPFPATVTPFGAGCAGSGGTPSMSAAAPPVTSSLYRATITNLPPSALASVFGMIGVSNTTWGTLPLPFELSAIGMPGCSILTSADFVVPLPIVSGQVTWDLQIPDDDRLLGGSFYQQALVFDPGISPQIGTVSNGLAAVVGNQ